MNNYQNPYYVGNPYGNMYQPMRNTMPQQQMQPVQPITQPMQQASLQGKVVDSIDVVKAMDIPLDGTTSYFPLTNGSAIVTKQLQIDGTSKTIIYKPTEEPTEKEQPKYITTDEFKEEMDKYDIKNLKRQLEDLAEDMKEINKKINKKGD